VYTALSNLHDLALLIVQKFMEKEYLFPFLSAQYSDALPQYNLTALKEFEKNLLRTEMPVERLRDWTNLIEGLKTLLLQPTTNASMQAAGVQRPIIEIVAKQLDELPFGGLNKDFLTNVLPSAVLVSHLKACILLFVKSECEIQVMCEV
jgi:hypothetical protein